MTQTAPDTVSDLTDDLVADRAPDPVPDCDPIADPVTEPATGPATDPTTGAHPASPTETPRPPLPATTGHGAAGCVVAVVVTYNRLAQLQTTLARLLASDPAHLAAVVVVDNASGDGTADWLATRTDPRLYHHRTPVNCGGAGGFETGMRLAVRQFDPNWVVVMDDDARPLDGALAAFHARPRDPACAYGAAVTFPDGRICEMNRPSQNPFRHPALVWRTLMAALNGRARDGYHIPRSAYDGTDLHPIDMTSFVGLFLPRAGIEATGYPQGNLFLYGDDVIYTLGLGRAGFSLAFDPGVRFEHDCSTFANDQARVFRPLWKVYYTYRNGLMMYHRAAGVLFWPLLCVLAPKWWLAGRRYGADRPAYLRLLTRALRDGVRGRTDLSHADVMALSRSE